MSRNAIFLTLVVLFALVVGSFSASAQPPQPPKGEHVGMPYLTGHRTGTQTDVLARPLVPVANAPASSQVNLGQPGLSYRYVQTFGVTEEPYPADGSHLNGPSSLFIDSANNLFVVEEKGFRLLKYNSAGINTMILGKAGQPWHHEDRFSWPNDVAVDDAGHIWVTHDHAIKEFDAGGNVLQQFPADYPWESGQANDRFQEPVGVAFDRSGRMYISDYGNHRVQVYTFDITGTPVYSTTIGVAGEPGIDNQHFKNPTQIVIDNQNRIYIADVYNYRIQRCEFVSPPYPYPDPSPGSNQPSWECEPFHGTGYWGSGPNEVGWVYGLGIDQNDNLFIADGENGRIKKCTTAGVCSIFTSGFGWISDVAVDSLGNVYISDYYRYSVLKFTSDASSYTFFAGTHDISYVPDSQRLNTPWGIAVSPDGSFYVTENQGLRLIKYNSAGLQQWTYGQAGVIGVDVFHFGDWWGGLEGNPAVDASGKIYVTDTSNHRVLVFYPNGVLFALMGETRVSGNDNAHFDCPAGAAVNPVNGDILIVDRCNQRIQVFYNNLNYKTTLGVVGETGIDDLHFNWPWGVAVDQSGNIYVTDADNHRVQKCSYTVGSYICHTFAGETGVFGGEFDYIHPSSVAVDSAGRVFITDGWNARVQVFDASGFYLTTIGGYYDTRPGNFWEPAGVAVDQAGNVYITDPWYHRIQKFAPGVPGWTQTNINGFGDRWNQEVIALIPFENQLYAGTTNGGGAQLWRSSNGSNWSSVMTDGFGDMHNYGIDDLIEFGENLYAGTWNCSDTGCSGAQIWRSPDGTIWSQMVIDGFGDVKNGEIYRFAVFNNQLYASTWSYDLLSHGSEIWRSSTGDVGSWDRVVSNGFGDTFNEIRGFEIHAGKLFVGTQNYSTGGEVWRSLSGNDGTWVQVNTDGFGDAANYDVGALATFDNYLYVATARYPGAGAQVWRCQVCEGSDWEKVADNGFGKPETRGISNFKMFGGELYLIIGSYDEGVEIWKTANGTAWQQIGFVGFGDSNNNADGWNNAQTIFNNHLYIGTYNPANGGEIWRYDQGYFSVFLPLTIK